MLGNIFAAFDRVTLAMVAVMPIAAVLFVAPVA